MRHWVQWVIGLLVLVRYNCLYMQTLKRFSHVFTVATGLIISGGCATKQIDTSAEQRDRIRTLIAQREVANQLLTVKTQALPEAKAIAGFQSAIDIEVNKVTSECKAAGQVIDLAPTHAESFLHCVSLPKSSAPAPVTKK